MGMHSYARLVESVRRTRNTLYLVAGLYVAIGFVVAVATAIQHDRLGTFLGFIIISGALSMGLVTRTALQVLVRVGHIEESLSGFTERVDELIPLVLANQQSATATVQDAESLIDLTTIGPGTPQMLAAATLNRAIFPRLALAMAQPASEARNENSCEDPSTSICISLRSTETDGGGAIEDHDRLESNLRNQFRRQVRERNFAAALETGQQITTLLPLRPVAEDFERLKPILIRRADETLVASPTAS